MAVSVIYFFVVLGLGLVCVIIGFISGPNRLKKPVPVTTAPAGNMDGGYAGFDYRIEKQNFLDEIRKRIMELKPNRGEDYRMEKQRRDVAAFSGYCRAGLSKILMPEVLDNERD